MDKPHADIDTRILAAEHRLLARQQRLGCGMAAVHQQLHAALRPQRLARPALLAAAGVAAAWATWWLAHRRPQAGGRAASVPTPAAGMARPALVALLAGLPWSRVAAQAWPLLPSRLRAHVSPAALGSALKLGLPLIEGLLARLRR